MTVEIVDDAASVEAEWLALWDIDPHSSPFQHPAWLLPWDDTFGADASRVLCIRRNGRLVGLLPLFRHEGRYLILGAGTSDYLDGVFAPGLTQSELQYALEQLDAPFHAFQVPLSSPLRDVSQIRGSAVERTSSEPCLVLDLPAHLSRSMRQNFHYYRRKAERDGVGQPESAGPEVFDELVELHTRRWNERQVPGVFSDPRVLEWHRKALPRLQSAGLLRMTVLRRDGQVVAALYRLRAKRRDYYYIGGFEPTLRALGLGTILVGHAIADAEQAGSLQFDFLRGREPYKYHWGAVERPTLSLTPAQEKMHA